MNMQVLEQLVARNHAIERKGIGNDVQRIVRIAEDHAAIHRFEGGVMAGPLFRYQPVQACVPVG